MQILIELKAAGLVSSVRGKGGGYRLAKAPREITLGDVWRAVDGEMLDSPALTDDQCAPVLREAWQVAGAPLQDGSIGIAEAIQRGVVPFQGFMSARTDPDTLRGLAEIAPAGGDPAERLSVLIPAFMLSEIQRAFEIGFLIALPFLIIDLVVSAVLMAMGMMMVPPVVVSLPFKLAFFVVVDGWTMIAGALVRSYQ